MTTEEHTLMIAVLSAQLALNKAIMEMLKSRGLVESDDLGAFLALVSDHQQAAAPLALVARQLYLSVAQQLGVVTGLEDSQANL
jgi:hypothetical protein